MLLLMQDPELRQRLASNALEYVKDNNWDVRKQEYLELVDSLGALRGGQEEARLIAGARD
jgi:glycosyltransferase involved in cell wall biosynthesis